MHYRDDEANKQEFDRRRRAKNVTLGLVLTALVVMFYLITVVKFQILIIEF